MEGVALEADPTFQLYRAALPPALELCLGDPRETTRALLVKTAREELAKLDAGAADRSPPMCGRSSSPSPSSSPEPDEAEAEADAVPTVTSGAPPPTRETGKGRLGMLVGALLSTEAAGARRALVERVDVAAAVRGLSPWETDAAARALGRALAAHCVEVWSRGRWYIPGGSFLARAATRRSPARAWSVSSRRSGGAAARRRSGAARSRLGGVRLPPPQRARLRLLGLQLLGRALRDLRAWGALFRITAGALAHCAALVASGTVDGWGGMTGPVTGAIDPALA